MSTEEQKEIARQVFEGVFGQGKLDLADDLFTDDFIAHAFPELQGPEGVKTIVSGFRTGFPDITWTVEKLIGEGEYVAARWTARGTHEGEFQDIPPTGNEVEIQGITMLRFENETVAEGWTIFDERGLLEQIGTSEPAG